VASVVSRVYISPMRNTKSRASLRRPSCLIAAVVLLSASCATTTTIPPAEPQFVSQWMRNYYGLIRAERVSPPVASRVLAYASIALYEGLAAASPGLSSLAGRANGLDSLPRPDFDKRYDPILVALAAERRVLDSIFAEGLPATRAALAALTDSLETAPSGGHPYPQGREPHGSD
jgi:hypothetical protein